MALRKEFILTLQQLNGIGNKTIFKIAETVNKHKQIYSIEDLCSFWKQLKGKKFESFDSDHIVEAYNSAKKLIYASERNSIKFVSYYDDEYPKALQETTDEKGRLDPPLLLWYRGNLSVTEMPGLAIIGTREATKEGLAGGEYISSEFAMRGFNIVSGLAKGCDTCGHLGALNVGGNTTAILANGLDYDSIYPAENKDLAEKIVKNGGLLLSEYPIGQKVNKYSLVARDRLQAALAMATLVVQTGVKGGTMHAAMATLKSHKPLYVMRFKDDATNRHEKCQGNAYLVEKGAMYICGNDNFDSISDYIKKKQIVKTLFD